MIVALLLSVLSTILHGWVLSILWGWFIVPTFSAPPLSIPLAVGISVMIGAFNTRYPTKEEIERANDRRYKFYSPIYGVFMSLLSLVLGFVIHLLV